MEKLIPVFEIHSEDDDSVSPPVHSLASGQLQTSAYKLNQVETIRVSRFTSGRLDARTAGIYTIPEVVQRIKTRPLNQLTENSRRRGGKRDAVFFKAGYTVAVLFSGTYEPNRRIEDLQKHSGLICISFKKLSLERKNELRQNLLTDPYTHILFGTEYDAGLKVVVKYDYNQPEDHSDCFYHLLDYYAENYNVTVEEHDPAGRDICQLCYLPYDPAIYYQPNSQRIQLPLQTEEKVDTAPVQAEETTHDKPNHLEPIQNNFQKAFEDEIATTKLFESIRYVHNWSETFFRSDRYNRKPDSGIRIDIKPDSTSGVNQFICISKIQAGEKASQINFEYDYVTNAIVIGNGKSSRATSKPKMGGRKKEVTPEMISPFLVDLLRSARLEQGKVCSLLEKKFSCCERSAREVIYKLLKDDSIIYNVTGKSVKLVKIREVKKHYLFLEAMK